MAVRPRRARPAVPGVESGKGGRPAHGALLSAIFDHQVHLSHVRRRAVHKPFTYADTISTTSPIGTDQDLRVILPSSPAVTHVFIGFAYQLSARPVTVSEQTDLADPIVARVDATLYNHATNALIDDPGCRWDYETGTLPSTDTLQGVAGFVGDVVDITDFSADYGQGYVHTTHRIRDGLPSISRPRCLTVPASAAGELLRVRLQTTNVRVLHVDVWERFAPEVG